MCKKSIQPFFISLIGITLAFLLVGCTAPSSESTSDAEPNAARESNVFPAAETTELPWIKTKTVLWQGINCLIPDGFETVSKGSAAFLAADPLRESDPKLQSVVYYAVPEGELDGWNTELFSERKVQMLLNLTGIADAETASAEVQTDRSHSRQLGEDVVCYHLYLEDADSSACWYCVSKFSLDDSNALVLAGVAFNDEGVLIFDRLVETFAAVEHKADMTCYIPEISITKFEQTNRSPLLYGINETDAVYVQIEDPKISRDISDYRLYGQAQEGQITLYVSKTDDTFMLIDDQEYEEALLTAKSDSAYFIDSQSAPQIDGGP